MLNNNESITDIYVRSIEQEKYTFFARKTNDEDAINFITYLESKKYIFECGHYDSRTKIDKIYMILPKFKNYNLKELLDNGINFKNANKILKQSEVK